MSSTRDLIDALVQGGTPVRRLAPPGLRSLRWLMFAALILVLMALGHGARPDLAAQLHRPLFTTGVAAALATGVLAVVAAFVASVPGRSMRWLLLPAPAAALWVCTIGWGCLTDWVRIGPEGVSLGETARCLATLALVSIPLSLALLLMLRHAARVAPIPIALMGSLAVAALTAVALSLLHPLDATVLILIANFGVTALFLACGGAFGRRLFAWTAG